MKKTIHYLLLFFFCISFTQWAHAQKEDINKAIDNWRYWKESAEQGKTPFNPNVPSKKPTKKGSIINSKMGVVDSPDVVLLTGNNVSQSENSVFVNPMNNQIALNSNNSEVNGTVFGTNALFSFDGGINWVGNTGGAGGNNRGDPAAAINNNGVSYIGNIAANSGQGISISTNNGATWTSTMIANPGANELLDKNHLWVDNSTTSAFESNLYSAWTPLALFGGNTGNQGEIALSRSTNDGQNWSAPITISNAVNAVRFNQGVNIQTGPNGEVYATWAIYDAFPARENAIGFARSTNGGVTFTAATRIQNNIRGIRWQPGFTGGLANPHGKNMRTNSFPVMAVDISGGLNDGNIYVVWSNQGVPGTNTGNDISVYMIRSTNQGNTWSAPIRVNQDPIGNVQYFPWITCDPVTGDLSVIFYDDRDVGAAQVEAWVATSTNGGNTWEDFRVSDVAFTPAPIPGLAGGYMGDYLGISARGGQVYPVWTDNRSGQTLTYTSPFQLIEECPENATITANVNSGQTETKQANQTITLSNTIESSATGIYHAGNEVLMTHNFLARSGSVFRSYIEGCTGNFQSRTIATANYFETALNLAPTPKLIPQYKPSQQDIPITLYPNPATSIVTVELTEVIQNFKVEIYSMSRGLMYSNQFKQSNTSKFQVDISNFIEGIYFIKVISEEKTFTGKIIKK
ncbi:T9SS type A sorting domain-containing protein [Kordia sp. YSTF-M3]|uniref:T9SS type A sorting domain-containing protein n=1 Tax=Kordia aestuariivivens TaxID=2759037 RepID=A0ABR7Q9D0_9FLAO|nr:3-coathanger stack domain-containing protein [Kordia aestuariivivens]MBC8755165.1 T9SS type A sorting domain-containing protein [Kordia aestuariivivens]